ncbi:hypothetical protein GDO81_015094 [Engystomops pustulosus]|uniref:RRM domain-containing protein n=1 Tax=Engystomops pustulosus TaxID=76066 RepID=A0AAV7AHD7_ENGPU|nr:hypothetical protein GDO81_015094 [Engystomops pustulosus]
MFILLVVILAFIVSKSRRDLITLFSTHLQIKNIYIYIWGDLVTALHPCPCTPRSGYALIYFKYVQNKKKVCSAIKKEHGFTRYKRLSQQ